VRASRTLALATAFAVTLTSTIAAGAGKTYGADPADLPQKLDRLLSAYPDVITGIDGNSLVLKDGTRLPISDGRSDKSFDELLDEPDIGDMFAFDYPAGSPAEPPPEDFDPGRIRVEALFRALYGDCEKGTLAKRRMVKWVPKHGGATVSFTTAQGADKALEAVSAELDKLPYSFAKYLVPSAGTYNCRPIARTGRMSMHAYAAAIDISTRETTYWQWVQPGADGLYVWSNKIPPEIVAIFEKHGFIWGGRWYHFDTMHFEYRPELSPTK
jgi:D-alanyl-D-alanine carboxypeptidase